MDSLSSPLLGTSLIVEYALLDVPVAMCAVYTELSSVRTSVRSPCILDMI